jgi:hypothetical protein
MSAGEPKLALFKVTAYLDGFRGFVYTGKLSKTLVITAVPELAPHFQPSSGSPPKLVHVSPLYRESGGRVEAVYTRLSCKGGQLARCDDGVPRPVFLEGLYTFYLGLSTSLLDPGRVLSGLASLDGYLEFMKQKVRVSVRQVEYIDPHSLASRLLDEAASRGGLKVVFSSPTQLRDPFRRGRHKSFLPSPLNVFSTPAYIYVYQRWGFKRGRFLKLLRVLDRVFNETYTALKTVRLTWFVYEKRPEPGLIGYAKYAVNDYYYEEYSKRLGLREAIEGVLAAAVALGTGTGRAAGLGHVFLEPAELGAERGAPRAAAGGPQ